MDIHGAAWEQARPHIYEAWGETITKVLPCPKIQRGQEELTPEQEAYAREFAQKRIASMLSTTAIDEREAEKHLADAYKVAGLEPPTFRWFDSPIAFILAHFAPSMRDSVWASVGASVWASVWASVGASVGASVWASVGASVRASVGASVGDSVGASVWDSVRASVRASVRDSVGASVRDSVGASVRAYYDENWLAFYQFFHEVFEDNELIHLALFNEMVSGYRLGSKEAWLVRKPIRLERDSEGRLHSEVGMCMQYADGWGFYAWHGVRCSEKIIMHPEEIAKEDWLSERNLEIRRVIQERLGNDRFVELVGGKCIDEGKQKSMRLTLLNDKMRYVYIDGQALTVSKLHAQLFDGLTLCGHTATNPLGDGSVITRFDEDLRERYSEKLVVYRSYSVTKLCKKCANILQKRSDVANIYDQNRLIEIDLGDDPERIAHYVHVQDSSTERQYYLRVPPTIKKADAGVAWTFGLDAQAYQPIQET